MINILLTKDKVYYIGIMNNNIKYATNQIIVNKKILIINKYNKDCTDNIPFWKKKQ